MTSMFSVPMSWTATLSVPPLLAAPPVAVLDAGALVAGALDAAELVGATLDVGALDAAPLDGGVLDAGVAADPQAARSAMVVPEASNFKAVRRVIPPTRMDRSLSMSVFPPFHVLTWLVKEKGSSKRRARVMGVRSRPLNVDEEAWSRRQPGGVEGIRGGERLTADELACAVRTMSLLQQGMTRPPPARSPILNVFLLLEASRLEFSGLGGR